MTLRIVHVASGREWRGGQRQVWLLARALASVLGQTHGDWRLVVVNDGGESAPVDALVSAHQDALAGRARVRRVQRQSDRRLR